MINSTSGLELAQVGQRPENGNLKELGFATPGNGEEAFPIKSLRSALEGDVHKRRFAVARCCGAHKIEIGFFDTTFRKKMRKSGGDI
jgi:hypothetical protein